MKSMLRRRPTKLTEHYKPGQTLQPALTTRTEVTKPNPKNKVLTPVKDVVCFKCHSTSHYKNECPNGRAFIATE